jgi:small subunit ribosomal protein S13
VRTAPKNPKDEAPAAAPEAAAPAETAAKSSKKDKPGRGKEGGKEAGKGEPKGKGRKTGPGQEGGKTVPVSTNPNFRYIVRVANTDLDGRRRTGLALTGVRGVGLRIAEATCQMTGVDAHALIGDLPESTIEGLETALSELPTKIPVWMTNEPRDYLAGETFHHIGPDIETARRDSINQMKMIRSYRGVRHERGQKVRGQRTRSNGRTGMAAGVLKKAAKEAAAAKSKEESAPAAAPAAPAPAAAKAPAAKAPAAKKE